MRDNRRRREPCVTRPLVAWQNWHHGAYTTTTASLPDAVSDSTSEGAARVCTALDVSHRSRSNVFSAPATWMPHSVFLEPSLGGAGAGMR